MAKESKLHFVQILILVSGIVKNAGDRRQMSRHTSEAGWVVKRANNEAVSWVGGRRGCGWTIHGPARGTWFKC